MTNYMDYPFQVNARGRTGIASRNDHVRDMIEQVAFSPVPANASNRPDFGCGLLQMVFGLTNDALIATVQVFCPWRAATLVRRHHRSSGCHCPARRLATQTYRWSMLRLDSGEILTDNFETG